MMTPHPADLILCYSPLLFLPDEGYNYAIIFTVQKLLYKTAV
jgi:hypothetical protein